MMKNFQVLMDHNKMIIGISPLVEEEQKMHAEKWERKEPRK